MEMKDKHDKKSTIDKAEKQDDDIEDHFITKTTIAKVPWD